jgi:hypothetical protein
MSITFGNDAENLKSNEVGSLWTEIIEFLHLSPIVKRSYLVLVLQNTDCSTIPLVACRLLSTSIRVTTSENARVHRFQNCSTLRIIYLAPT